MPEPDLTERRLALEERKSALDEELARERLALDQRQAGRFSGGMVTLIGAGIAVVSAVATTTIGGVVTLRSGVENNAAQLELKTQEVIGDLEIKRTEVEGLIRVQELQAEAERSRLEIEQKFEIIVQATKGLPPETASANLQFFVEAGILDDPDGRIARLAEEGRAPDLPTPAQLGPVSNPLLERVAQVQTEADLSAPQTNGTFAVSEGVLLPQGGVEVSYQETSAHGAEIDPSYVILHFTTAVGPGITAWLTSNQARASAHVLVQRDGSVIQLLPFDHQAWHAGRSSWGSLQSLNRHSVGIVLENWGKLTPSQEGWTSYSGHEIAPDEIFLDENDEGWHSFTEAQIKTVTEIIESLIASTPQIVDILGHSDVSPLRKIDPGPAFPMRDLREAIFGRGEALPPPG
ncbi:MAG: N-acetylmuramoyl-L-alanine amidase [Pseudomonadota bacterium]